MREFQTGSQLSRIVHDERKAQTARLLLVPQSAARQIFQCQERVAIPHARFKDGCDIRMIQSGDCFSLALKPRKRRTVVVIANQKFQGYDAIQASVARLVDDTHPALAARLKDFIVRMFATRFHG